MKYINKYIKKFSKNYNKKNKNVELSRIPNMGTTLIYAG